MFLDSRKPPTDIAGYDPVATAGDCTYDAEAGEKVVEFFYRCLKFIKGPKEGEPFRLEGWQADIVRTLFGWKQPDGRRRYRQAYIGVPRKNGKSTFIAGISLYMLCCDAEGGAECYCAASGRDQASLVFNSASMMCRKSSLASRVKVRDSQKRIIYKDSFLRAIPANEGTSHGFDSHFIAGDELHAWPGREFHDVLHTSTGARAQPLELYITTAGHDRTTICYEKYSYAKDIRDGKVEDQQFLPVIFEAGEDEDWTDPDVWRSANPNLGVSVYEDYIERECLRAKREIAYENTFRQLHLNQWQSQLTRWLRMSDWDACGQTKDDFDPDIPIYGGLDLSSTTDISAWMLVQRAGTGWKVRGHYFIPQAKIDDAGKNDRVPYHAWAKMGLITVTPDRTIDYDWIHNRILADAEKWKPAIIGYDKWNATATRIYLENQGLTMLEIPQTFTGLTAPCKELERAVIDHEFDCGNDPVLSWMAENVEVKYDPNQNIRPVKPDQKYSGKRIDGIVAAANAIATAIISEPVAASVFDTQWDF